MSTDSPRIQSLHNHTAAASSLNLTLFSSGSSNLSEAFLKNREQQKCCPGGNQNNQGSESTTGLLLASQCWFGFPLQRSVGPCERPPGWQPTTAFSLGRILSGWTQTLPLHYSLFFPESNLFICRGHLGFCTNTEVDKGIGSSSLMKKDEEGADCTPEVNMADREQDTW